MGVPESRSGAGPPAARQDVPALLGQNGGTAPDQFVRSLEEEAARAAIVMTPTAVPTKSPRIRPVRKVNKSGKSICAPIRSASGRIRCLCQRTMAAPLTAAPGVPLVRADLVVGLGSALGLTGIFGPALRALPSRGGQVSRKLTETTLSG